MYLARLVSSFALALLAPAYALGQDRTWEWEWHPMWFMWGAGGLVMILMMLVFWGLVIAGLVVGLRWLVGQRPPVPHPVSWTREGGIEIAPPPSIMDPDATVRSCFIGHAAVIAARAATGV